MFSVCHAFCTIVKKSYNTWKFTDKSEDGLYTVEYTDEVYNIRIKKLNKHLLI